MFQIYDTNGKAVGKPGGYKTHKKALSIAHRRNGLMLRLLWKTYNDEQKQSYNISRFLYTIAQTN